MVLAYLIGSIPFGVIIARMWNIDLTRKGSGNIGATNVMRTIGTAPGAVVLLLDLLKGTLAVYLGTFITKDPLFLVIIGATAILGHMFPIFLKFKGGRGSATGLGVLLAIAPDIFIYAVIIVIIIIALFRYVSLASIIGPICVVGMMYFLNRPLPYTIAAAIVALLIIIKHVPNIKRLLSGTERKIGEKTTG